MSEPLLNQILLVMQDLQVGVGSLKAGLQEVKTEVQDLKSGLQEVRAEVQEVKTEMNVRFDKVEVDLEQIKKTLNVHHVESINADNMLMSEIQSSRGNILFVNRKVSDMELEIDTLKRSKTTV